MEENVGKLYLSSGTSKAMRYSNFTTILNVIEEYLKRYRGKSELIIEPKQIINQININKLLNHDKDQKYLLSEIIILLTVVSSRNNIFIDRMLNCDDHLIQFYLGVLDKYILLSEEGENLEKKYLKNYEKLYKSQREAICAKYKLQEKIEEQENRIFSMQKNIKLLIRNFYY